MLKTAYKSPEIDFKFVPKSLVLPDQTLTIEEIMKRFVRGVPVDIHKPQAVFVDQSEMDLEQASRMDFAEKHELAQQMAYRAQETAQGFRDAQQAKRSKSNQKPKAVDESDSKPAGDSSPAT